MKSINEGTIGGRIRISRQKTNLSLKQMAEKIDVSSNYVSIIERNVKKPSDELLGKIAALTNVPFFWLKNGNEQYSNNQAKNVSSSESAGSIGNTNISLFLNLILQESPSISKETIATFLNIEDETLDDILNGNAKFDSAWELGLLNLAQRLEISDILKQLHGIEAFLVRAENKKIDSKIVTALRNALSEGFHDDFIRISQERDYPERFEDMQKYHMNTDIPVREFSFLQETTHDKWKVKLFAKMGKEQLEQLLYRTRYYLSNLKDDHIHALAFSDKDVFSELLDILMHLQLTLDSTPITVVLMFIDLDSMRVTRMIRADIAGKGDFIDLLPVKSKGGKHDIGYPEDNKG